LRCFRKRQQKRNPTSFAYKQNASQVTAPSQAAKIITRQRAMAWIGALSA
jgi:hypothetical protein